MIEALIGARWNRRTQLLIMIATFGCVTPLWNTSAQSIAQPVDFWADHDENEPFMGVRLRGALRIGTVTIDRLRVSGLSGLAYDEDDDLLYAVSDRGILFHFRPIIEAGQLTGLLGLAAYRLDQENGRRDRRGADAEGMEIVNGRNGQRGDARLVISFERNPRVIRYTPEGHIDALLPLPPGLNTNSDFRKDNNGIEAITYHPGYGWMAAPEKPKDPGSNLIPIRTLDRKFIWYYPLADEPNPALVALEAWPDGSVLSLERAYGQLFVPIVNTVRRMRMPSQSGRRIEVQTVARFDSTQGWLVDNFEGLSRHKGQRFFIVSDDNENILQANLLVYLELTEDGMRETGKKTGTDPEADSIDGSRAAPEKNPGNAHAQPDSAPSSGQTARPSP